MESRARALAYAEIVAAPLPAFYYAAIMTLSIESTYETGEIVIESITLFEALVQVSHDISAGLKLPEEFPVENSNGGVFGLGVKKLFMFRL
jgi:hypothetical protein